MKHLTLVPYVQSINLYDNNDVDYKRNHPNPEYMEGGKAGTFAFRWRIENETHRNIANKSYYTAHV